MLLISSNYCFQFFKGEISCCKLDVINFEHLFYLNFEKETSFRIATWPFSLSLKSLPMCYQWRDFLDGNIWGTFPANAKIAMQFQLKLTWQFYWTCHDRKRKLPCSAKKYQRFKKNYHPLDLNPMVVGAFTKTSLPGNVRQLTFPFFCTYELLFFF